MTSQADNTRVADDLRPQLEDTGSRIDDLRERISALTGETKDRLTPFLEPLDRAGRAVKTMLRDVTGSTGDRARDVADDARRELQGMEDELTAAGEALRGELAESATALRDAASRELEAWRARLDHLVVQADLGRMEARDEAAALRARAEHAYHEAKLGLERASQRGTESVDVVRSGLGRVLEDVRSTVSELRAHVRGAA